LNFSKLNQGLITSLSQSDIVVINGEGTLHRLSKGSLNLLYMIYICKKYFNKKVHLINFSCFPNGDLSMPNEYSQIYINIISYLDSVIPRDCYSNKILSKCGIKTMQGFDCLPQYLNRYGFVNNHAPKGGILVSGGVSFDDNRYKLMEDFISYFLDKNITVKFLYGAQFSPASEDLYLQDRLKKNPKLSNLIIVQAKTMLEWIEEIRIASFLFSARFHHTIAALTIGTPFSYLSSNTPKISAAIETLGEDLSNLCIEEGELDILKNVAATTLLQSSSNKSEARLNKMLSLAAENFNAL
jgi:polysaccharide pyruvyl transferase WcaK-like protein